MAYVHVNFLVLQRKSYAPHILILGFSTVLQNDKNVYDCIALTQGYGMVEFKECKRGECVNAVERQPYLQSHRRRVIVPTDLT